MATYERVTTHVDSPAGPANRVLNLILSIIETLLGLRFLFLLFGANPGAPIVASILDLTAPLIAPFSGIFPSTSFGQFTIDWTTLVAMLAYAIIASLIATLLRTLVLNGSRA